MEILPINTSWALLQGKEEKAGVKQLQKGMEKGEKKERNPAAVSSEALECWEQIDDKKLHGRKESQARQPKNPEEIKQK